MKIFSTVLATLLLTSASLAQDEEAEPPWNITAGSRYMSRYTAYGLDLSNNRAALGHDLALAHKSGCSVAAGAVNTLGTGGELQQWSIGAGYDWQISELLTLSGEYTHFVYANDSVNVLASLSNSLSLSAELALDAVDVGFSYDTFLGTNSASYFGLDISGFHQIGEISIVPLAQISFMSQSVESRLLKTGKTGIGKGGPPSTTTSASTSVTTVTGLSSLSMHVVVIYPVVSHLSVVFHPSYQYSPKGEVSTRTSQFIWSIGLRYSHDF